jgi:HSP20 family protein
MANITRIDPFQDIGRYVPFGDLAFSGWPRSLRRFMRELPDEPPIKLDVTEDDKAFYVKAEVPGVKKEDIAIEVDGNQVSLSTEVKRENEEKKGDNVLHSERFYGRQFRSFTLGRDVDRDKVEAKLNEGVLEITLPKNGGAPSKRVAIR